MRFDIRTISDAQALSRVLEHFALRTLIPDRVQVIRTGDVLDIVLEIDGMDDALTQLIEEKIRASVLVLEITRAPQSPQCLEDIA